MKIKPGMSYSNAKKAELTKAKVDQKMDSAMRGAGMSEPQVQDAKQSARAGRNSGPTGVHTDSGNFQESKDTATKFSKYNSKDQKSIKPSLEKAKIDDKLSPQEKVKVREQRNSRSPKQWKTGNPKHEGQFAGKQYSLSTQQSGVHHEKGHFLQGNQGSMKDAGGKRDKIDSEGAHNMAMQGLKNTKPKLPDAQKSEFKAGMSYADIKKAELEKGIFHDAMAGASLGAAMLAIGTAHEEKKYAHMPMGHAELHDTGGQTETIADPTRTLASVPEKVQSMKQKIGEIRKQIKPNKGQE